MRSQSDAEIATQAASLAGELLLQLRHSAATDTATDSEALRTAGDRDANRAIMKLLANERPEDSLLSEEAADDPRRLIAELIPKLNRRLTATGTVVGEPRLRTGDVLRIEGVGIEFGGLYRVTSVTHTLDYGGFRTAFGLRKEIWFGSIPLADQGAVPLRVSF